VEPGELWAYRARLIDELVEVVVLRLGTQRPYRGQAIELREQPSVRTSRAAGCAITNQPCSGGGSGFCDPSESAAGEICEVAGGHGWAAPGLMELFAEYSGGFCGHAAGLDAFVED
jgi:hypothetical protein